MTYLFYRLLVEDTPRPTLETNKLLFDTKITTDIQTLKEILGWYN